MQLDALESVPGKLGQIRREAKEVIRVWAGRKKTELSRKSMVGRRRKEAVSKKTCRLLSENRGMLSISVSSPLIKAALKWCQR